MLRICLYKLSADNAPMNVNFYVFVIDNRDVIDLDDQLLKC